MRSYNNHRIWFASFLLLVFATGCSDLDRSTVRPPLAPATVSSVAPVGGAIGACPNTIVTATFGGAMNPATINTSTFALTGPNSAVVAGQVTYSAGTKTATFTSTASLAPSTVYTATITTGAKDLYGNAVASNVAWSFTTGVTTCSGVGVPTVLSVTPATGACPNTITTARFSEAMNPSSIDGGTFTLTGPGSTPVAGVVTYDPSSNTAIFTPPASLATSTLYTATITTGASDLLGADLATNFVWTFTTAATSCLPPLPPAATTPPTLSVGVCSNALVTATFPQAMNPTTITATTFTLTGPGVTSVAGAVTHDVTNKIFTFTPTATLALSTVFTATITTGAKDASGNALASNFVWTFTTAAAACTPGPTPTVVSVTPPAGAIGVCPNAVVNATFSEVMNPATISTTTFTLAGPGVTPVNGTVTLDGTGQIATFTPSAPLLLNTIYTGTITTGAQNMSGTGLTSNFAWSFTTATLACQSAVPLGSVGTFEIIAGSTVTNTGPTTIAGGDLGLSPGSAVTGFPPGTLISPAVMHVTDPAAAQAELDLTIAYNTAALLPGGASLPGNLSGLTFAPGLYTNASTVMLSVGNVTLDAQGNANAVFIFQVGSTLTTIGSTQVILAGGAQAKNVFWQVGSSATLGTNSIFKGTILALQSITLDTGANLQGRALARNGGVTLDSNTVTAP